MNRDDRNHQLCVDTLQALREPLLTTWMPVTEAMYLLEFSLKAQGGLLEMIERGVPRVLPLNGEDMLPIRALMEKYEDLPTDFADATLVQVANREKIRKVFTLDRRDFSVYRLERGKSLTIVP